MNMNQQNHGNTPDPVRAPAPTVPVSVAPRSSPDGHHGLLDAFHLPSSQAERRALRFAAERLVGPGGA